MVRWVQSWGWKGMKSMALRSNNINFYLKPKKKNQTRKWKICFGCVLLKFHKWLRKVFADFGFNIISSKYLKEIFINSWRFVRVTDVILKLWFNSFHNKIFAEHFLPWRIFVYMTFIYSLKVVVIGFSIMKLWVH